MASVWAASGFVDDSWQTIFASFTLHEKIYALASKSPPSHPATFPTVQNARGRAAGVGDPGVQALLRAVGERYGPDSRSEIEPATEVPSLADVKASTTANPALLKEKVVLKLNGGLGTSMGLDFAKSLLEVKGRTRSWT